MEIKENQIFNLFDTNGRRNDVLNALRMYVDILIELQSNNPEEEWMSYPKSLRQYRFYKEAIEASPEVFKEHPNYDWFEEEIAKSRHLFLAKDREWIESTYNGELKKVLKDDIEARARHYTSNLVKIGFADNKRRVTSVGEAFCYDSIEKDAIEDILPIKGINLILLRQLLKIKVFTEVDKLTGKRKFYSPIKMALWLVLNAKNVEKKVLVRLVQGLTPYTAKKILHNRFSDKDKLLSLQITDYYSLEIPDVFKNKLKIEKRSFDEVIKNRRSGKVCKLYYDFYNSLYVFIENKNESNYKLFKKIVYSNQEKISNAFGCGEKIFDFGRNGSYELDTFLNKNKENVFLNAKNINMCLYEQYFKSKKIADIEEYSDTTVRMLEATGIFQFKNGLVQILNKDVLKVLFEVNEIRKDIYGTMTEAQYLADRERFVKNNSISEILGYTVERRKLILDKIKQQVRVDNIADIKNELVNQTKHAFIEHIESKYTKGVVVDILKKIGDRTKDSEIKKIVNENASVPTIFEYITAIAWYYISDKKIDVYDSLNLTLDSEYEPIIHAGAGKGDIVISYDNYILMVEATMMNKNAQKRGEWEPVLRHTVNLKAEKNNKEVITFFVADELDLNTINIWRAVAAVPLKATNSEKVVDNTIIMPLKNDELLICLENNIELEKLINSVEKSFGENVIKFDENWREDILKGVLIHN